VKQKDLNWEASVYYTRVSFSDPRPEAMMIFLYRWKHGEHEGIDHVYCYTYEEFKKLLHHWNGYKEPLNDTSETWKYFELEEKKPMPNDLLELQISENVYVSDTRVEIQIALGEFDGWITLPCGSRETASAISKRLEDRLANDNLKITRFK
jgi:hypothetical protein